MARRIICISYKMFTLFFLALGILLNVYKTTSIRAILSYYTLQSNLWCLLAFFAFTFLEFRKKRYKTDIYYMIKGAIIIEILITAVVYRIALAPTGFSMDSLRESIIGNQFANFLVHTFSPLLVTLDYFFFDEKGNFKYFYPFIWLILPLNYIVYVYTYSSMGGKFYSIGGSRHFAYFFLDYEKIGYIGVLKWIIAMAIFILMIGLGFVVLDKLLARIRARKWKNERFRLMNLSFFFKIDAEAICLRRKNNLEAVFKFI